MPDWLSALMPTADEEPQPKAVLEDEAPLPVVGQAARRTAPPTPPTPEAGDALDDLRSQVAVPDAAPPAAPKKSRSARSARSARTFGGLLPWQVFFLSVLLFLDVAIIGMLFLVMLERVVLP